MTDSGKIDLFLSDLKSQGRSSPVGHSWMEFHAFLAMHQTDKSGKPPVPLILAASGESNSTKHSRLREQLEWAAERGLLPDALVWLDRLTLSQWNTCLLANWDKTSYAWD